MKSKTMTFRIILLSVALISQITLASCSVKPTAGNSALSNADGITSDKNSSLPASEDNISQGPTSYIADSLKLDDYKPPADGINYDKQPLTLNKPMNIITRKTDKLYDGSKEFRFISINGPTTLDSTAFGQEDLVKTIAQMGGQVMRTYTFSVKSKNQSDTIETFITEKNKYNETAFKRMDNLLALANKYGVRLIIPFIDPYVYNGGIPALLEMHGVSVTKDIPADCNTFYSDDTIEKVFFDFVKFILNRKNSITGIYYKDDPAILAWETGNELQGAMPKYNSWVRKLVEVIKNIDKKHLIMDGWFGIRPQALADPSIDIVSHHFYPAIINNAPFVDELIRQRNSSKGQKPLVIGEYGFVETAEVNDFLTELINGGTTGAMVWSLRNHTDEGGFIQHAENEKYKAYHWPGFKQGDSYDETALLRLIYLKGYEIQGKNPKLTGKPTIPSIIEPIINPVNQIKWQGSTGAYGYDFQRSDNASGTWKTIGVNISDDFSSNTIMFRDQSTDIVSGKTYYYRIRARSAGGFSDWSKPVSCTANNN